MKIEELFDITTALIKGDLWGKLFEKLNIKNWKSFDPNFYVIGYRLHFGNRLQLGC